MRGLPLVRAQAAATGLRSRKVLERAGHLPLISDPAGSQHWELGPTGSTKGFDVVRIEAEIVINRPVTEVAR
jgi:hypothetical protein